MPEFKIEGDGLRREARFRVVSWGIILLLLTATALIFTFRVSGRLSADSDFRFVFAVTGPGMVIGACVLAVREALYLAARQMVFVLDGNEIVRKRKGFPDIRIAFSEIRALREGSRWLVIESVESQRRILVSKDVEGFEAIRAQLAKHHPVSVRAGFPLKGIALLAISILSWGGLLSFREMTVFIPAAVGVLITMVLGWRAGWMLLRRACPRPLLWAAFGFSWLAVFLVIYLRIVQG